MRSTTQHELLPIELFDNSLEHHLARHGQNGPVMYLVVVSLAAIGLGVLPMISVDIAVQSAGIIRPSVETHEVRARVSGIASDVLVHENQTVRAGDSIAVIRSERVAERAALVHDQLDTKQQELHDLTLLIERVKAPPPSAGRSAEHSAGRPDGQVSDPGGASENGSSVPALDPARLRTVDHRQDYLELREELRANGLRAASAARELARALALAGRGFAPPADVDARQLTLDQAVAERSAIVERYRARWTGRLAALRLELRELQSSADQLHEERALYVVTAPVSGTVESLASISRGSWVQAGETLAVISPGGGLVAEVLVSPRDIGLVRPGGPVRLLIDAFNYTDWGVVTGRVLAVSDDVLAAAGQPTFRVRCTLDRTWLALTTGVRGRLKKGMTLRARFLVAHRSLFQLLRDDVSDWLDPTRPAAPGPNAAPSAPATSSAPAA